MNWKQTLHFEWQVNAWVSGKALKERGNDKLSLSFPTPCSCISFCMPFAHDFSWYPLNGELARRLLRFSLFWEIWLHSHHNGSVNNPSIPIPRNVFVKYWHLLWLLTSEQEQTKLLKLLSVPKPINSNHFCEIYLQLSEEISPFLGKNNLLPNWKVSLCCFEELKMLCNPSHSPVLFHDPYLGDLNNSYKNRSPLRKKN